MENELLSASRILIVDDTPANIGIIYNYLDQLGFSMRISEDGETALALMEKETPDLILLDIMLPGMDGYETCRRIKALPACADVPVIFMSALSEVTNKIEGFKAGGVDYITKPFHREEILERVKTHLTIKKQRDKLRDLNRALEEAVRSKDRFFSIIAHDLRGPFTALLGAAEMIKETVDSSGDKTAMEMAAILKTSVENTYLLLENLLEWSRLQRNVLKLAPEDLALEVLVRSSCSVLRTALEEKGIDFRIDVPEEFQVFADRNMLSTIIRNLTGNAIKFTPRGGVVAVRAYENGDRICVEVRDTGVGIERARIADLFMADHSTHTRGTEGEKGSGLGLLLVKDFVERHGGVLKVESEPGKGSLFAFDIARKVSKT